MKVPVAVVARTLALAWAGFWLFFFVAESAAWRTPVRVALLWVGLGLLFVVLALIAWRWEIAGGLLLMAAGLLTGVTYGVWSPTYLPVISRVSTIIVGAIPPVVAGILFLMHRRSLPVNT